MAAGLEGDRKVNLMDMLAFLLFKCDLSCYVRTEIKKYEPCPYLMGYHLPAFCVKIHGSYCMFQCAEGSFNAPSEMVYFLDFFRTEFVFGKVCYNVLICSISDRKTQDTQGYFVFPVPFSRQKVKCYLLIDVAVLVC